MSVLCMEGEEAREGCVTTEGYPVQLSRIQVYSAGNPIKDYVGNGALA